MSRNLFWFILLPASHSQIIILSPRRHAWVPRPQEAEPPPPLSRGRFQRYHHEHVPSHGPTTLVLHVWVGVGQLQTYSQYRSTHISPTTPWTFTPPVEADTPSSWGYQYQHVFFLLHLWWEGGGDGEGDDNHILQLVSRSTNFYLYKMMFNNTLVLVTLTCLRQSTNVLDEF